MVAKRSEGRKNTFTKDEAKWIDRVLRALPGEYSEGLGPVSPAAIYYLAREYMLREEQKSPTDDLDQFIAYWRQGKGFKDFVDYCDDVDKGWITPPRGALFTLVAEFRESEYEQETQASQSRSDEARKNLPKEGKEWMDRWDKEIEKKKQEGKQ